MPIIVKERHLFLLLGMEQKKIHDDDSNEEISYNYLNFLIMFPEKNFFHYYIYFIEELKILVWGYDNGSVTSNNIKSLSSEVTLSECKKVIVCKFI